MPAPSKRVKFKLHNKQTALLVHFFDLFANGFAS
jgi:hypothetical protein